MDWHWTDIDKQFGITEKGRNTDYYGGSNGWTGYSWNKTLFPDYKSFLKLFDLADGEYLTALTDKIKYVFEIALQGATANSKNL